MKRVLMCSLVSLSLFGCGKTELTCGDDELKSFADKAVKEHLMKNDLVAVQLPLFKALADKKKMLLPDPTFNNIFPGLTVELTDIRLAGKDKETNKIRCEANISSKQLLSGIAGIAKKVPSKIEKDAMGISMKTNLLEEMNAYTISLLEQLPDGNISIAYEAQRSDDKKSVIFKSKVQSKGLEGAASSLALAIYAAMVQEEEEKLKPGVKSETVLPPTAPAGSSATTPNSPPIQSVLIASTPTTPPPTLAASAPVAVAPTPVPTPEPKVDTSAFAPSFDCAKASTGPERLICSDRDLSKLDVALSQAYSKAREKSADKNKLKSEQLEWFKRSRNACADKTCMENAYKQRISDLGN